MEYIRVILLDLPLELDGVTVFCEDYVYIILINVNHSNAQQCRAYDREVSYINQRDYSRFLSLHDLKKYFPQI